MFSLRVNTRTATGLWWINGAGDAAVCGLYSYCRYNDGLSGYIKRSPNNVSEYYQIEEALQCSNNNDEADAKNKQTSHYVIKLCSSKYDGARSSLTHDNFDSFDEWDYNDDDDENNQQNKTKEEDKIDLSTISKKELQVFDSLCPEKILTKKIYSKIKDYLKINAKYPSILYKFSTKLTNQQIEIDNNDKQQQQIQNIENIECVNGELPIPNTIELVAGTLNKMDTKQYIKKFKEEDIPNRCLPNIKEFSKQLIQFLNVECDISLISICNIIVNEYLLCNHLYSKIGIIRIHEEAKHRCDLSYIILFCTNCHFIWSLPKGIRHYGYKYDEEFPMKCIKNISYYLGYHHAGRGAWGARYGIGESIGWNNYDRQPFVAGYNTTLDYFDYVKALNKRIETKDKNDDNY